MPRKAAPIPGSRAQRDAGVGPRAVRVPPPVLRRQDTEVKRAAAKAAEVRDRSGGAAVVEVLEHVVTEDEVEGPLLRVVDDAAALPAVAAAEVLARLETDVARAREPLSARRWPRPQPASSTRRTPKPR